MPNDTILSLQNSFVMVSIEDLQRLQAAKASGLVIRTRIALRSFMWAINETEISQFNHHKERQVTKPIKKNLTIVRVDDIE